MSHACGLASPRASSLSYNYVHVVNVHVHVHVCMLDKDLHIHIASCWHDPGSGVSLPPSLACMLLSTCMQHDSFLLGHYSKTKNVCIIYQVYNIILYRNFLHHWVSVDSTCSCIYNARLPLAIPHTCIAPIECHRVWYHRPPPSLYLSVPPPNTYRKL